MSLFVAIPSGLDTKTGFARLDFWHQESEWIFVTRDGGAIKAAPDPSVSEGLVLVSLAYLKQTCTPETGTGLINRAAGVFIHPGGTDTPNLADAARALEDIPDIFRYQILAKTVAFTRSGAVDYKVEQLTRVWNWMSSITRDKEKTINGFVWDDIPIEFGRLRGKQGRDAIARACLLAQGSIDDNVAPATRKKLAKELIEFLKCEGAWLKEDNKLKASATALGESVSKTTISALLQAVRERFGENAE